MLKKYSFPVLSLPEKASAAEQHLNLYVWWLLVVTNLVDVLVSRRAFDYGVMELNPIIEILYSEYGINGVVLVKAFWIFVLFTSLPYIRGWYQMLFALASLIYLWLAVEHLSNLPRLL